MAQGISSKHSPRFPREIAYFDHFGRTTKIDVDITIVMLHQESYYNPQKPGKQNSPLLVMCQPKMLKKCNFPPRKHGEFLEQSPLDTQ